MTNTAENDAHGPDCWCTTCTRADVRGRSVAVWVESVIPPVVDQS